MPRLKLLLVFLAVLIPCTSVSLYVVGRTLWTDYKNEHSYELKFGLNGDEIYLDGAISAAMAADLERHLDRSKTAVHSVFITSPGGTAKGAEDLVKVLADHPNVTLKLAEDGRCFSACVGVFAGAKRLNRVVAKDKACFLFHAGSAESRESRMSECEIRTPDHTLAMDRWVAEISPQLSTFFAHCQQNPTHTLRGMLLDSKQLMEISENRYALKCEDHVPSEACLRWFENYQQCPR